MKEPTSTTTKLGRLSLYTKKRPAASASGVSKKSPSRRSPSRPAQPAPLATASQAPAVRRDHGLVEDEYRETILEYMHEMELKTMCSLPAMDQQPEIRWNMRPCLIDFLIEVHFSFRLRPETLYLAINIIDRYVSRRVVYTKHYQLVGCAALSIAAKFEDEKSRVPTLADLVEMCRGTYEESAFLQMEGHILSTIQWMLGAPTPEAWLRHLCSLNVEDQRIQHVSRFLMEITLFHRDFVTFLPSVIARGALTLARFICNRPRRIWEETEEALEVVELLDAHLAEHTSELSETLVKKYAYAFYSKASTFVVRYFLNGGRFTREMSSPFPMTPMRNSSISFMDTPMSSTTSVSDFSDDGPLTPSSSSLYGDPYVSSDVDMDDFEDKENFRSFEPTAMKNRTDDPPDQYLPHDYVTFGRTTLQNRNASSTPQVA
ncbi:hypothetical protein CYLTODRAFT_359599 [Cylindrobasidium torrendii FP15055 ss-10]|uniref:Uncharacterized protein n=1 Tax=Cylindrobasidium torrendii FP15055 ss-10 TaxID=1314674 RepID=A0A0D7B0H7_9AGAR|nr:hypothetical protein CYLTODRAFT_359599 [Cylindrobasidium torrendii FP15055 ss-10]